jgi:hypothetical protein
MRRPTVVNAALAALVVVAALGGLLAAIVWLPRAARHAGAVKDPVGRLSQLLRQGARPGELTKEERGEAEQLLLRLLPRLDGALSGYRWRVAYDDLPEADFVSVDLVKGDDRVGTRALWLHLLWRGALPAAERASYALRLGHWPARGIEGHHLFVRVGGVELRAVADAPEFRDAQKLRDVLDRFDLDALARL